MARYIDADLVLELFKDVHPLDYNANAYVQQIKKLPTADVKPIVYGEWIDCGLYVYECSNCYNSLEMWWEDKYKFCPNCGANMRKEQQNEDSN